MDVIACFLSIAGALLALLLWVLHTRTENARRDVVRRILAKTAARRIRAQLDGDRKAMHDAQVERDVALQIYNAFWGDEEE